jgi:site-specific DNA recombinase
VEDGQHDGVVFLKWDRLGRRLKLLAEIMQDWPTHGARIVAVDDGYDSEVPGSRVAAAVMASMAEAESETISYRRKAAALYGAERGQYVKGGIRPFGRNHDGTIVPAEADGLRYVVERILEGESIGSMSRWLNEQGLTPPPRRSKRLEGEIAPSAWVGTALSRTLRRPDLRGIRGHNGIEYPGNFEAIIDEATGLRLVALLTGNRPSPRDGRRHLLTGLMCCGLCGQRMGYGSVKDRSPDKPRYYKYCCRKPDGAANCGRIAIGEESTDAYVVRMLLQALLEYKVTMDAVAHPGTANQGHLQEELERAKADLGDLYSARYSRREMDHENYVRVRSEINEKIEHVERKLSQAAQGRVWRDFGDEWWFGDNPKLVWDSFNIIEQRDMLRGWIDRIEVAPATSTKRRVDPTTERRDLLRKLIDQAVPSGKDRHGDKFVEHREKLRRWIDVPPTARRGRPFETSRITIVWNPGYDPATFEHRLVAGEFGQIDPGLDLP